jgi:hypothetical protein
MIAVKAKSEIRISELGLASAVGQASRLSLTSFKKRFSERVISPWSVRQPVKRWNKYGDRPDACPTPSASPQPVWDEVTKLAFVAALSRLFPGARPGVVSDFGFRASDFFRTSDFGLRISFALRTSP